MPSPFKKQKPFLSYRVYFNIDPEDTETASQFECKKDVEYNLWYLDADKYKVSPFPKNEQLRMMFQPFKAIGRHQYFL
jgi:hypothetical protein